MTDIEVLRKIVAVGAVECNVEPKRALALLERLTGTGKPQNNEALFKQLAAILGHSKETQYSQARKNKLRLRLKAHKEEVIVAAAQTIAMDDYMMGSNGRKYGTVDYLLRSDETIDNWWQQGQTKHKAKGVGYTAQPKAIKQSQEVKRADPEKVAEAKRKLMERLRKV